MEIIFVDEFSRLSAWTLLEKEIIIQLGFRLTKTGGSFSVFKVLNRSVRYRTKIKWPKVSVTRKSFDCIEKSEPDRVILGLRYR